MVVLKVSWCGIIRWARCFLSRAAAARVQPRARCQFDYRPRPPRGGHNFTIENGYYVTISYYKKQP